MDDVVQHMPPEFKTTRSRQQQREIIDFVHVGDGRFIRFRFQRRMNPYLVLLNSLHLISAVIALVIIIFLNVWLGVAILLLTTGLFSYLRYLVHPRFIRGWLLSEEVVVVPIDKVEFPSLSQIGETTSDDKYPFDKENS